MPNPAEHEPIEQGTCEEPRAKPRRHWLQFSLRTLLAVTALAAGGAMLWRMYIEPYRRQRETMALIEKLHGTYETTAPDRWLRWLFGADFQNVTLIDVGDCDEPEVYLAEVAALPALEILAVGGEPFTDKHLRRLRDLKTLRCLVLDSTDVTCEAIGEFCSASSGVDVYESDRRATRDSGYEPFPDDTHARLPGTIDARYRVTAWAVHKEEMPSDKITDADLAFLKHFRHLGSVYIEGNQVTDATLANLKRMRELTSATILSRQITEAGVRCLRGLTQLRELHLDGTPLTDAGLAHLQGLSQLEQLSISDTAVTDAGLAHLRNLTRLETLSLANTQTTDAGLLNLHRMCRLKSLDLSRTKVTDRGVAALKILTRLESLSLVETMDATDLGTDELLRALPKCKVQTIAPFGINGR